VFLLKHGPPLGGGLIRFGVFLVVGGWGYTKKKTRENAHALQKVVSARGRENGWYGKGGGERGD